MKKYLLIGTLFILVLVMLYIFMPVAIPSNPLTTPQEYLGIKPYLNIGDLVIIVPSSTIIVYLLGVQIILLGAYLYKNTKKLWGLSFIFWGIGTVLAGTSYQGLGYELKCSGYEYCIFTSWLELSYLFVTGISIGLMALAFAFDFAVKKMRKFLEYFGVISIVLYSTVLVIGSVIENSFLISYELFTIFFMPIFIVFFVINIIRYRRKQSIIDRKFIVMWILFLIVNVAYYAYYFIGITESLYMNSGIWFSANDVLHVGLIIWFLYIRLGVSKDLFENKSSK